MIKISEKKSNTVESLEKTIRESITMFDNNLDSKMSALNSLN